MLGTVFHYAVVEPEADHSRCAAQVENIRRYHESIGYRKGGAYNGDFCQHGEKFIAYLGPNQATGDTWANLNLHAWSYLGTVDTPVTDAAAQAAYDLTLVEPTGRDMIFPHSYFYNTSCCGDPLRAWIANGAQPPLAPKEDDRMQPELFKDDDGAVYLYDPYTNTAKHIRSVPQMQNIQQHMGVNKVDSSVKQNDLTRRLLADATKV